MKRVILAFLIAPIAPLLVYKFFILSFLILGIFSMPIAYLVSIMWGIPLFQIIRKRPQLNHPVIYSLAAGFVGLVASAIVGLFFGSTETIFSAAILPICVFGAFHGACSGFIFWLIMYSCKNLPLKESLNAKTD